MGTAALDFRWDKFQQAPVRVEGAIKLTGLDLTRARPYLPPPLADTFASGTFRTDLKVAYTVPRRVCRARRQAARRRWRAWAWSGRAPRTRCWPRRLGVGIKGFDLEGREVTLSSVELTGFDAQIRRDREWTDRPSRAVFEARGEAPSPRAEAAPACPGSTSAARARAEALEGACRAGQGRRRQGRRHRRERVARGQIRGGARDELAVEYAPTAEGVPTVLASGDVTVSDIVLERAGAKEKLGPCRASSSVSSASIWRGKR